MQVRRTSAAQLPQNCLFVFLVGAALIGVLMGVISQCFMSDDFLGQISEAQNNFLEIRRNSDYIVVLIRSFSATTMFLGAAFVMGFSAIAQPLEFAVPVVKGMGLGVTMAQAYSQSGRSGIAACALLVVPSAVISTYAVIIGAREAVKMSNRLITNSLSDRAACGMLSHVKLYGTRFLVLEALAAVAAAVDCLCTLIFINRI